MTDYNNLKNEKAAQLGKQLDRPELAAPQSPPPAYGAQIASEPQALDAVANGGRFIIVGETHNFREGMQKFIDLMPTFQRAKVKKIGLEEPPSHNELFTGLQDIILERIKRKDPAKEIIKDTQDFLSIILGENRYDKDTAFINEKQAVIFYEATRRGMKIVGIDPRPDDKSHMKKYFALKKEISTAMEKGDYNASAKARKDMHKHNMSLDPQAAAIANKEMATEDEDSRMALLYGHGHGQRTQRTPPMYAIARNGKARIVMQEQNTSEREIFLADELRKYGSVTTIATHQPYSERQNYYIAPEFGKDADLRSKRDGQPPTEKMTKESANPPPPPRYVR